MVTQVCPGPVDSEFDDVAGSAGGMTGGPPQFMRVSAAQCAHEALAGFERAAAMVFPGRPYWLAMHVLARRPAGRSGAGRPWPRPGQDVDPYGFAGLKTPGRFQPWGGRSHSMAMRTSRLLITGAAVGTIVGTARADINDTHVFNKAWPPHARFHGVAAWGTVASSQLLALWLTWRPGQRPDDEDLGVKTAALLPFIAWAPFFVALATPGAEVEDEPGHLRRIAGIPLNLVPATVVPFISATGYYLYRRGRRAETVGEGVLLRQQDRAVRRARRDRPGSSCRTPVAPSARRGLAPRQSAGPLDRGRRARGSSRPG